MHISSVLVKDNPENMSETVQNTAQILPMLNPLKQWCTSSTYMITNKTTSTAVYFTIAHINQCRIQGNKSVIRVKNRGNFR